MNRKSGSVAIATVLPVFAVSVLLAVPDAGGLRVGVLVLGGGLIGALEVYVIRAKGLFWWAVAFFSVLGGALVVSLVYQLEVQMLLLVLSSIFFAVVVQVVVSARQEKKRPHSC